MVDSTKLNDYVRNFIDNTEVSTSVVNLLNPSD
jgi:hypothetical protein